LRFIASRSASGDESSYRVVGIDRRPDHEDHLTTKHANALKAELRVFIAVVFARKQFTVEEIEQVEEVDSMLK
jgi:hypothetical protein